MEGLYLFSCLGPKVGPKEASVVWRGLVSLWFPFDSTLKHPTRCEPQSKAGQVKVSLGESQPKIGADTR